MSQSTHGQVTDSGTLSLPREYPRATKSPTVSLVLGTGAIVLAAAGMSVAIMSNVGPFALQTMTTLPLLAGLAMLGRALMVRSDIRSVIVDETAITIHRDSGANQVLWADVAWNMESLQALSNVKRTTLFDRAGKTLVRIPEVVERFDELVVLINRRVKSNPDASAELVRRKRLKKQACLVIGFGLGLATLTFFLAVSERDKAREEKLLKSAAIDGIATIERKFIAPNGVTKRVEYRIDLIKPDGQRPSEKNVEVSANIWDSLSEGSKFPVRYVPADPEISRLALGQIDDPGLAQDPVVTILLLVGASLFSIFTLVMGVLNIRGIDLVKDAETKRLRFARSVSR